MTMENAAQNASSPRAQTTHELNGNDCPLCNGSACNLCDFDPDSVMDCTHDIQYRHYSEPEFLTMARVAQVMMR